METEREERKERRKGSRRRVSSDLDSFFPSSFQVEDGYVQSSSVNLVNQVSPVIEGSPMRIGEREIERRVGVGLPEHVDLEKEEERDRNEGFSNFFSMEIGWRGAP